MIPEESKASLTAPGGGGGRGGRGGAGNGGGGARRGGGTGDARTTDFEYGKDWTVAAAVDAARRRSKLSMFRATWCSPATATSSIRRSTDPYQGIDVKGKIVVVAGLPPELAAQQAAAAGAAARAAAVAEPESAGRELAKIS